MLMPETAVHEDHFPAGREHQVGFAGKIRCMQAVPVSKPVDEPPHREFGLHILAADGPHVGATVHYFRSNSALIAFS
jgi:hypothetical protein